jgi:hypothetical protein
MAPLQRCIEALLRSPAAVHPCHHSEPHANLFCPHVALQMQTPGRLERRSPGCPRPPQAFPEFPQAPLRGSVFTGHPYPIVAAKSRRSYHRVKMPLRE